VSGFRDLEEKLNAQKWLRGKFIIFPNVTEKGHKTLLRDGFAKHYQEMPCVGGYVDGNYLEKTSEGKRNILEGRQQNNGYQPIAVIQTSDSRSRSHASLGSSSTYIKWSEPTAEALRQACLARGSRICLIEPVLPSLWITSFTVTNSKFLGRVDLDWNQQYNAIIGGRGTGKSTILEYLRWGLCDQPIDGDASDIVQTRRKSLIDNTLQKFDGEVQVEFLLNDVRHIVKRNSKKQEISLRIGDGTFVATTEQQVRRLLPIQAYSQKQLSSVGVRIDELRRFVELPIEKELEEISSGIRDVETKLRSTYGNLTRLREVDAEVQKNDVEIQSQNEQLATLRNGLKGLSDEDQKTIAKKATFDVEESLIQNLVNDLDTAKSHVDVLASALENSNSHEDTDVALVNTELVERIRNEFAKKKTEIAQLVEQLAKLFEPASRTAIDRELEAWKKAKTDFETEYAAAKARAKVNRDQLDQIRKIEIRVAELRKQQTEKRNAANALGDPKADYAKLRENWKSLLTQRAQSIRAQCSQFTSLSDGLIRAEIENVINSQHLTQKLKAAFAGMNVREDKLEKICQLLAKSADPIAEWNRVLAELEQLVLHGGKAETPMPDTPILNKCNFIDNERTRIANQLKPDKWLDLSVSQLQFNPTFSYCTSQSKEEYIEFKDASAGQQATALFTVLLNQEGAPLIIDQPEDDIDSKLVKEIIEKIWKAKGKRQLIFASHNANFVVNGDAELVICCDYIKAGDQTQGTIKAAGAIDNTIIREEITLVTEGGREAFKLRKDMYGF